MKNIIVVFILNIILAGVVFADEVVIGPDQFIGNVDVGLSYSGQTLVITLDFTSSPVTSVLMHVNNAESVTYWNGEAGSYPDKYDFVAGEDFTIDVSTGIKTIQLNNNGNVNFLWAVSTLPAVDREDVLISSNYKLVGWEQNVLFNAPERFSVTQSEPARFTLSKLFDGSSNGQTANGLPSEQTPIIITIEDIPTTGTPQRGYVGFVTRNGGPKKFLIEGWNNGSGGPTDWEVLAYEESYTGNEYFADVSYSALGGYHHYTKLRYTFYEPRSSYFRISELLYLSGVDGKMYDGLFAKSDDFSDLSDETVKKDELSSLVNELDHLELAGDVNTGANISGSKLLIKNYDNDGNTVYPIKVVDENDMIDFYLKNRDITTNGHPAQLYFNGNMGIGTETPSDLLHIEGTSNPAFRLRNSTTSTYLQFGIASGVDNYALGATEGDAVIRPLGGANLLLHLPYVESASDNKFISIGTSDYPRQLNVFDNGKVTIGTTDDDIDAVFTVVGKTQINGEVVLGSTASSQDLTVYGKINAREVMIEPLTADFVFAEDYKLASLDSVEVFIDSNKHLPGVPSAKSMIENGVGIAQMNQLLLQKVEELTLYMIELKKQNALLKKDMDTLKK